MLGRKCKRFTVNAKLKAQYNGLCKTLRREIELSR